MIVVDNGSTDATQLVAREFRVDLVVFPENRGFAAAVNEGIRRAKGDWLLILNNDVVLEPEWLERLLASAEQENASFAAGKLLRMDDFKRLTAAGTWSRGRLMRGVAVLGGQMALFGRSGGKFRLYR